MCEYFFNKALIWTTRRGFRLFSTPRCPNRGWGGGWRRRLYVAPFSVEDSGGGVLRYLP